MLTEFSQKSQTNTKEPNKHKRAKQTQKSRFSLSYVFFKPVNDSSTIPLLYFLSYLRNIQRQLKSTAICTWTF